MYKRTNSARSIWRWIVEHSYGILNAIFWAAVFAEIAYLFGALPGWPFTLPIIIATCALLLIIVPVIRRSRRRPNAIQPITLEYQLERSLDLKRLALSLYVKPDPLLIDNTHHFSLIHQTYILDGYDGTFILRYKGENATKQVSRLLRDSVVGDSPADTLTMAIQALDKAKRLPLRWNLLKDNPYEKLIEIYFFAPLHPGDTFDIEFSCRWPGTFTRQEDYVFYPIHYYKHGVEKLVGELILRAAPSHVEGLRFDGKTLELDPTQPRMRRRRGEFVITWEIKNPRYIYLLQYGRQDIDAEERAT